MKRIAHLSLLFLTIAYNLGASDYYFPTLQGLRGQDMYMKYNKKALFFEMSGYEIQILHYKGTIEAFSKGSKIEKKYKIKNVQAKYSDTQLAVSNVIVESQRPAEAPEIVYQEVYFVLQAAEKEIAVIYFVTLNQRNIVLEKDFVNAYLDNALDPYILEDQGAETIDFAGKTMSLGNACIWNSPHNMYCNGGQISWSEFLSYEEAELDLDARIAANNSKKTSILLEEEIDILFDSVPAVAYRVVYVPDRIYPKATRQAPLIVYYVNVELRGRYISCIMSNYGYNRHDYELAPLLEQFMTILDIPESAHNALDKLHYEQITEEQKEHVRNYVNQFEIRIGSNIPLGTLNQVYTMAPSIEAFAGVPFGKNMNNAIDVGFQIGIPVNRKEFNYYYKEGGSDLTKATLLPKLLIRYRLQKELSPDIYNSYYVGLGYAPVSTNLLKGEDEDGNKTYYEIGSADIFGGVNIRYKSLGAFVEYHIHPYSLSDRVDNNFGNYSLNIGAFVTF